MLTKIPQKKEIFIVKTKSISSHYYKISTVWDFPASINSSCGSPANPCLVEYAPIVTHPSTFMLLVSLVLRLGKLVTYFVIPTLQNINFGPYQVLNILILIIGVLV